MNGVLVVDKPAGPTSHDVVARLRRVLAERRIGHTGTLDPLATGVLPLVLGRATRLAALLSAGDKEYLADIRFGQSTPTYDAAPRLIRNPVSGIAALSAPPPEPAGLTAARIEAALPAFVGTSWQMPPAFSAKKIEGTPAYKLARRSLAVATRPAEVTLRAVCLEAYAEGLARIRLSCSSGFYVRSFAHELGLRLECGAHLEGLRRTRAGDFGLDRAVPLDQLDREGAGAAAHVIPLARLLPHLPSAVLSERGLKRASHGNTLSGADLASTDRMVAPGRARLLDQKGALVAIAEIRGADVLHPYIVLV